MARISILAAVAANGVIGRDNDVPWKIRTDLKRLKNLTMGHHVIMGRRTFESLPQVLPGRTTIVITRDAGYRAPDGVLVVDSIDRALDLAKSDDETFILG